MKLTTLSLLLVLTGGLVACSETTTEVIDLPAETPDADPGAGTPGPGIPDEEAIGDKVEEVVEQGEEAVEDAVAQADGLIAKITAYLEENKVDLAKKAFAQLETLKDKLPASYQDKIASLGGLIDKAGLGDKAKGLAEGLGLGD